MIAENASNASLILTLTAALSTALVLGYITHLLKLSPIVGYLIAGVILGPHTPGYSADHHLAQQMAEVGVILLMFSVGLHFHFTDLWRVRKIALPGALVEICLITSLGMLFGRYLGWGWDSGLVFGLSISVASTVVLTRVLMENNQLHTLTGHIAIGWLVVEDIFTVLVLILLPILFSPQVAQNPPDFLYAIIVALLKVAAMVGTVFLVGGRLLPAIFARVSRTRSQELFTLTVLATVLGIAVGSSLLFNVSVTLGAFVAGMVVGQSEFSVRAASEALPIRDAFAVLFFVSVGMLLKPTVIMENAPLVLSVVAIVICGKGMVALSMVLLLGYSIDTALAIAVSLCQIGEFSFILASLARSLGLLSELASNILVATAIITITINPILFWFVPKLKKVCVKLMPSRVHGSAVAKTELPQKPLSRHAVIIGYGPIGKVVRQILSQNHVDTCVVDLNHDTLQTLKMDGGVVVYGDASRKEVLDAARIKDARFLLITASRMESKSEVVRLAKEINPHIVVIARASYMVELDMLKDIGADRVYVSEGEVALAMTEDLLTSLGALPEHVDHERHRIRRQLYVTEVENR